MASELAQKLRDYVNANGDVEVITVGHDPVSSGYKGIINVSDIGPESDDENAFNTLFLITDN
jgi:hypothetical protein